MSSQIRINRSEHGVGHATRVQKAEAEQVRAESESQDANRAAVERELAAKVTELAVEKVYSIDAVLAANTGCCALSNTQAA